MDEPILLVALEQIKPNPYQPPERVEDLESVTEIAISISRRGLHQEPVARAVNGQYELAFGHTRLAAYRMLRSQGVPQAGIEPDEEFARIPLKIRALSDREMFEMAADENIKRKDLNPIQIAKAMRRYLDEFQASSEQAGELFGMKAATVRGKVRLLDLPEEAQALLARGEISEGKARQLLNLKRVAPDQVVEVAEKLANTADPDMVIANALRQADEKKVLQMWAGYYSGEREPRGGDGLWPLTYDHFPYLPFLSVKDAVKGLDLKEEFADPEKQADLHDWIFQLEHDPQSREHLLAQGVDADLVEQLAHLIDPPACTACPFMAKSRGEYYCGLKLCHSRKKSSWLDQELEKVHLETGIEIYSAKADGKATVDLERWKDDHKALFEARDPDLRLKASPRSYSHDLTGSETVKVMLTGERAKKIKEKERGRRESYSSSYDPKAWERQQAIRAGNRERLKSFVMSQAIAQFEGLFVSIDSFPVLEYLASNARRGLDEDIRKNAPKSEKMAYCRRVLAFDLVMTAMPYGDWLEDENGAIEEKAARHLQGVAKTFGVALPKDWVAQAVAVETEEA